MSERMNPLPFNRLLDRLFAEHGRDGSAFGVPGAYIAPGRTLPLFAERIETPFGPAAGPNTQLAENIIAAYFAGARFFELKTVQKIDGEELARCIARPCILAFDEGYNCEWSTELTVEAAREEYVKAWLILKVISRKWGLGDPNGFVFNMSVGYDLEGIKTEKLDGFINGLIDASKTEIWKECMKELSARFPEDRDYLGTVSPKICTSATVSTLHGCPPGEIEAIASYLIREKGLNTFVKCNPTILGYEFARARLDALGYDYVSFDGHHFKEDLQYSDAVPMIRRLMALAAERGLEFGVKLSNTFPAEVRAGELPSEEMYMSGRSLYPLTIEMAARFAREFGGALRISYSGGADAENIKALFEAGIWPITVATTILKPGGYARLTELGRELESCAFSPFTGVDAEAVTKLSELAGSVARYKKPTKPIPSTKMEKSVPLIDCYTAPCEGGCPIHQDIPEYIRLMELGKHIEALRLIVEKNPLPNTTGAICAHRCMDKCTRNFYDGCVNIRGIKLDAVDSAYGELISELTPAARRDCPGVAVIGAGPAGIAAAYFLSREGIPVTVFDKEDSVGGVVHSVIPSFRIDAGAIARDAALAERLGARFVLGADAPSLAELRQNGFDKVLLAFGAGKRGALALEGGCENVIDFLMRYNRADGKLKLGSSVAVIGGGNSAMDAARAAVRTGARTTIVYRRTKRYMPADAEELELAINEGVEFMELASPVRREGNRLVCRRMKLGAPDAGGRRSPVDTDELFTLSADSVIAAVGEKPDAELMARYGVTPDERGRAPFDCGNGVFSAGDVHRGPATVVEAIADARAFADTVAGEHREGALPAAAERNGRATLMARRNLQSPPGGECARCLGCSTVCENCVSVCPNRANVAITVPGMRMKQILHIDRLCNECGNCATFCPYTSLPYREKLTLFSDMSEFDGSENSGFIALDDTLTRFMVRLNGVLSEYSRGNGNVPEEIAAVIDVVASDYGYLV